MHRLLLGIGILAGAPAMASTGDTPGNVPAWTGVAKDGRLLYARDEKGNRLPDFGGCGYREGRVSIPDVPVKARVQPGNKDDRAAIQDAIDRVSTLPPNERGVRGAVLLAPGEFKLSDGVSLSQSGVVLRGSGDSQGGTILRATAPRKHTLITIAGKESQPRAVGDVHQIIDPYVPVGALAVKLGDASGLAVGDAVMVRRPSTSEWIKAIGMDQLANPWTAGQRDCAWERIITGIDGQTVFLNAPVTTAIEGQFGGGTLAKYEWPERIENCGIEDIQGVSDSDGSPVDEQHGWIFVGVQRAVNCWVKKVTARHFGYACVAITDSCRAISVLNSQCIDPVSQSIGGRRYGFYLDDSQLCLVQGCSTRNDRHQFVTGSNTCGPNAFVDGMSETAKSDAGPHHRWANGILWDSVTLKGGELNARNRGNSGSGHGWAGANCVFWNCRAEGFIVENPPTARNWCIGAIGAIRQGRGAVGVPAAGTFHSHGMPVQPASLFAAQRRDAAGIQRREYVAAAFNRQSAPGGIWSHRFQITPGERIRSASLSMSVRGREADGTDVRGIDRKADLRTEWPDATVLCFDLATDLGPLNRGTLEISARKGLAVDWAVLEVAVDRNAASER